LQLLLSQPVKPSQSKVNKRQAEGWTADLLITFIFLVFILNKASLITLTIIVFISSTSLLDNFDHHRFD